MNLTRGVWVDKDNNVYATDEGNNRVLKYSPGLTAPVVVAGGNGSGRALNQLSKPVSVVVDNASNIYITEENNQRVVKWLTGATQGIIVVGNYSTSDSVLHPGKGGGVHDPIYGFVSTNDEISKTNNKSVKIYISDLQSNEVQLWYEGDTSGITIAGGHGEGDSATQLHKPFGNYVFGNYLYVADHDNARIQRFNLVFNPTSPGFVANKEGKYSVTASFSNGCKSVSNIVQIINCNQLPTASSFDNLNISDKLNTKRLAVVFPNPVENTATISFSASKMNKYILRLNDAAGKTLLHKEITAQVGLNSINIDVSAISKGLYFITIIGPDKTQRVNLNKE